MATPKAVKSDNGKAPRKVYSVEEKRQNFRTAASKRTGRVLKAIRALSGVTRPTRYAWTDGEVSKIVNAIAAEMDELTARFQTPGKRTKEDFTL